MRQQLRGSVLSVVGNAIRPFGGWTLDLPGTKWLYFHSIPADGGHFDRLLERLCRTHRFVRYSEAVALTDEAEPRFCVSIDDGFESSALAAEIAERHGGSVSLFIPTAGVGLTGQPAVAEFFRSADGIEPRTLSWDELEMLQARGHEIGSHSMWHRDLSTLSHDELHDDLGTALSILKERLGAGSHFAWPYGRWHHASSTVLEAAFSVGHTSVASAERGRRPLSTAFGPAFRRDHIDPSWPLSHALAFLASSSVRPEPTQPGWIEETSYGSEKA